MMTIRSSALLIGAIAALGLVFQTPALAQMGPSARGTAAAQPSSSPAPLSGPAAPPATVTTSTTETLQYSVIQYTGAGTALSPGFNAVFQTVVNCPAFGCTFGFEDMIQVGLSGTTGNRWAICGEVDGNFINPPCPFQGVVPEGLYETRNSLQSWVHVGAGAHTLTVLVYVDAAATLGNCEAIYRVYAP